MPTKTLRVETVAQAYLELLRERGIEYFFANAGTDFASIIDGFAKLRAEGRTTPRPLLVPHEYVAVSMAHGYYAVTGRPQVVMVHVTVGTANGVGAIINAARTQTPVIFSAGRTPITEDGPRPGRGGESADRDLMARPAARGRRRSGRPRRGGSDRRGRGERRHHELPRRSPVPPGLCFPVGAAPGDRRRRRDPGGRLRRALGTV